MTEQTNKPQRREYRRPAGPELVTSVPEAANNYSIFGGQDFGNYTSAQG